MKILITGASGYVGRLLIENLSTKHNLIATARNITKIFPTNITKHNLDILSFNQARETIYKTLPDVVIHAAALPKRSKEDNDFIHTNVEGAKNVALATKQFSNAKFIMISSGCAFKQTPNQLITLDSPRETTPPFAYSKNRAETEISHIFAEQQHRAAIVYPPVILHPLQVAGIIPSALSEAQQHGTITNKVLNGHVNLVHHSKFAQLLEAIAHDQLTRTLQRYLINGNRFATIDFLKKLQYIFAKELNLNCTIRTLLDPHMETMCQADESKIKMNFPGFEWGNIDDVIVDICRNIVKPKLIPAHSTLLITQQLNSNPAIPAWIPKNKNAILSLDKQLAEKEKELLQTAEKNIAKFFLKTRKEMLSAPLADNDFPYRIFEPVLKRLILNMIVKFEKEPQINNFIDEAQSLLNAQIPYKKTIRFVVKYLNYLDEIFMKVHPELAANNFHRNNAEHVLETLLNRAPHVLLYPSFHEVNIDFFLNTRAAPFHIAGIDITGFTPNERVPYADGFPMKPSEFFWHDIGHDEFMENTDHAYLTSTFKPIERVVEEWDFTRHRIRKYLTSIQDNINLLDATKLILFEILHERGFQYSLAVLKAQLDTPKWTEILNRKFKNNYYKNSPEINLALFPELENARSQLLTFIGNLRARDQSFHVEALHGDELSVRITHFPKVSYGQGILKKIIIDKSGASVLLEDKNKETITRKISELILAQINPTASSPFDTDTRKRIEMVFGQNSHAEQQSKVVMSLDKSFKVMKSNGQEIPLKDFIPWVGEKDIANKNRNYFEMEQVLGSCERGELISYTHQDESRVYIGTVHYDFENETLEVRNDDEIVTLPASEVLVDPMQKEDFTYNKVARM